MGIPIAVEGCTLELPEGFSGEPVIVTPPSFTSFIDGKGIYSGTLEIFCSVYRSGWSNPVPATFSMSPQVITKTRVDGSTAIGEGDETSVETVVGSIPGFWGASADPRQVTVKLTRAGQSFFFST